MHLRPLNSPRHCSARECLPDFEAYPAAIAGGSFGDFLGALQIGLIGRQVMYVHILKLMPPAFNELLKNRNPRAVCGVAIVLAFRSQVLQVPVRLCKEIIIPCTVRDSRMQSFAEDLPPPIPPALRNR